jgi:1-acyl-sn-glycerol-3-phosphate acyltransferase
LREEVPIVPVAIDGSYKLREGNNGLIKASDVKLTVTEAIYPSELSKAEKKDLVPEVRNRIEDKL